MSSRWLSSDRGLLATPGEAGPPPHDIDVLVVGEVDRADLYDAADRARERLGIEVNPVLCSEEQWADPSDPLVAQIEKSAHLSVLGTPEEEEEADGSLGKG